MAPITVEAHRHLLFVAIFKLTFTAFVYYFCVMFLIKSTNNLRKFRALTSLSHRIVSTVCELNMTITEATLRDKLSQNLKIEHLNIIDESNCSCGLKFNVVIVSDDFNGKSLIERHRMVNSILEDDLKIIHAFSQKTLTVEQWKKKNEN